MRTPFYRFFLHACLCLAVLLAPNSHAERIRDLTTIQGVRSNSLLGYGLVVVWTAPAIRPCRRRSPPKA